MANSDLLFNQLYAKEPVALPGHQANPVNRLIDLAAISLEGMLQLPTHLRDGLMGLPEAVESRQKARRNRAISQLYMWSFAFMGIRTDTDQGSSYQDIQRGIAVRRSDLSLRVQKAKKDGSLIPGAYTDCEVFEISFIPLGRHEPTEPKMVTIEVAPHAAEVRSANVEVDSSGAFTDRRLTAMYEQASQLLQASVTEFMQSS